MSSTPSLTHNSSDLEHSTLPSTAQDEESLAFQQAIEAWRIEFASHNVCISTQNQPAGRITGLSDDVGTDGASYGNDSLFQNAGEWVDSGHAEGSSTKGYGPLEARHACYPIHDEHCPPFPFGVLASREAQLHDVLNPDTTITNSPNHASGSPATSLSERAGGTGSNKLEISRAPPVDRMSDTTAHQFICDKCGVPCQRQADLKRHKDTIHMEGPVYTCDDCFHVNGRKDKMREHCRRKHRQTIGSERYGVIQGSGF